MLLLVILLGGPSGRDSVSVSSLISEAVELRLPLVVRGASGIPVSPTTVRRLVFFGAATSLTDSGEEAS